MWSALLGVVDGWSEWWCFQPWLSLSKKLLPFTRASTSVVATMSRASGREQQWPGSISCVRGIV